MRRSRLRWILVSLIGLVALVSLGMGALWWFRLPPGPSGALAHFAGMQIRSLRYSPDGERLLVVVERIPPEHQHSNTLDEYLAEWYEHAKHARLDFVSPARRGLRWHEQRLVVLTGDEVTIGPPIPLGWYGRWYWSNDGARLESWGRHRRGIVNVPTLELREEPLPYAAPPGHYLHEGVPSPDGRYVAHFGSRARRGASPRETIGQEGLAIFESNGGLVRLVFNDFSWAGWPVWRPDGKGLIMRFGLTLRSTGLHTGQSEPILYFIPVEPDEPVKVLMEADATSAPGARPTHAPKGDEFAVIRWVKPSPAHTRATHGELLRGSGRGTLKKVYTLGSARGQVVWSPRGDWIAIGLASLSGSPSLTRVEGMLLVSPDGGEVVTVHSRVTAFAWHPTGEKLAVASGDALYEIPVPERETQLAPAALGEQESGTRR